MKSRHFEQIIDEIKKGLFVGESLDFLDQIIDDKMVVRLAEALKNSTHIKKICLFNQNIGDEGAKALATVKTIEELDLSNGLAGYDEYENHITSIGVLALANSNLKRLKLNGNSIGNDGAKFLAKNKTIIDLELSDCSISDEGAAELFNANATIQNLNLRANKISDNSLKGVYSNNSLISLDLSCCHITDDGMKLIAQNTSINDINLDDTNVTKDGVKTLLEKNNSIKYLSLNGCKVSVDKTLQSMMDDDKVALKKMRTSYYTYTKCTHVNQQNSKRKIEDSVDSKEKKPPRLDISE